MPEQSASQSDTDTDTAPPRRLLFRIPPVAMLAVLGAMICAVPFAFGGVPGLQLVYVFPVAAALWILRNRTTVDAEQLVARRTFGRDVLAWSDVTSLRVGERSWVRAVLADSREVPLPAVRLRHLPMLAAISGGRLADPMAPAEEAEASQPPTDAAADNEPVTEQPGER